MSEPRTKAGKRLLWMLRTEPDPIRKHERWPRTFDARLVERIAEEFIEQIEAEAIKLRTPHR